MDFKCATCHLAERHPPSRCRHLPLIAIRNFYMDHICHTEKGMRQHWVIGPGLMDQILFSLSNFRQ